jgi:hypothetical protein
MPGRSGQVAVANHQPLPASQFAGCTALAGAHLKASAMETIYMVAARKRPLPLSLKSGRSLAYVERRSMLSKLRWELIPVIAAMAFIIFVCLL